MRGEGLTPERFGQLWSAAEQLTRAEALHVVAHAKEKGLFRADLSHWEVAELFHLSMRLAIFDAQRVANLQAFRELWFPIVGEAGECWIVPLYLAAVSSPLIVPEERRRLVADALYLI